MESRWIFDAPNANGNNPKFKTPKVYDPSLAEQTLQKTQSQKLNSRQSHMLAQLGLADAEGVDVDSTEDEDEDEDEAQSSQPTIRVVEGVGGRLESLTSKVLPEDGVLVDNRSKAIKVQGTEQYRGELAARAGTAKSREDPGLKETIASMVLELEMLGKENKVLKQELQEAAAQQVAADQKDAVIQQYEEDIQALQGRVVQLEKTLALRDNAIECLQNQLTAAAVETEHAKASEKAALATTTDIPNVIKEIISVHSRHTSPHGSMSGSPLPPLAPSPNADSQYARAIATLQEQVDELTAQVAHYQEQLAGKQAANDSLNAQLMNACHTNSSRALGQHATVGELEAQLNVLQAAMDLKDMRLADALAQVEKLSQEYALQSRRSAGAQSDLEQLQASCSAAQSRAVQLDAQVQALQQQLSAKASEQASKQETNKDRAAGLDKQLAQAEQRIAELEAELKVKSTQLAALKQDMQRPGEPLPSPIKAPASQTVATPSAPGTPPATPPPPAAPGPASVTSCVSGLPPDVVAELEGMRGALMELHDLREGILSDLVAMQNEVFNKKMEQQMVRLVRDKEVAAMKKIRAEVQAEVAAAQAKVEEAADELAALQARYEQQLRIKDLESEGQINMYKERWRQEFDKRRKLHDQLLEARGNIRVLCRVRPLLEREAASTGGAIPVKPLTGESLRVAMEKGEKDFDFDRVFAPNEGQVTVFQEVEALVTSALDGYHVCIMAYGQTGSGKTHTMEGLETDPGVNARSLQQLFSLAAERSQEWTYHFSASVLEIYNEQIFDLLSGVRDPAAEKLDVKQGPDGMFVPGLRVEAVKSTQDVADVIDRGKRNRSTFATNMNEHSSRSHLVLSVYVHATSKGTAPSLKGKLHLIDLAGSERIGRTGAQGDRLKEAQNINKSLSALGDVIQALQMKQAHIPYRNSKLTRLLEDSLGANSKCVLVVNVSPAQENVNETKCSLEFASRARKVELGRARQHTEGGSAPPSGAATPRLAHQSSGLRVSNSGSVTDAPSRSTSKTFNSTSKFRS